MQTPRQGGSRRGPNTFCSFLREIAQGFGYYFNTLKRRIDGRPAEDDGCE